MNIKIPTERHCIETGIKREYNKAISNYFRSKNQEEKKDLESRIEFLHHALQSLDFNFLRSSYKDLQGDSHADVRICGKKGALYITVNGEKIETRNTN